MDHGGFRDLGMSYQHLKERVYYESLYDRLTVESARKGIVYYDKFVAELKAKLPPEDKIDRPGNALILNLFYMQAVGDELLERYEARDDKINSWMARDQAKDEQMANARLAEEPICQHCGRQGMRIIDKSLMHRGEGYARDESEEVLFMLKCAHCDKNSGFWQDGTSWKTKATLCLKCGAEVTCKTSKSKKSLVFIYSCPACGHSYKEKMETGGTRVKLGPGYESDRLHYCLVDKEFRDKLFELRSGLEGLAELGKKFKEQEDNKPVYDAISQIKKLKIPELASTLAPEIEKAGYVELSLDKPEIGKDVIVGFNCLDSRTDREDYDSRKDLRKLVTDGLKGTNWRLMSDGISYRLGYLSGRLRACEREEDLIKLVQTPKQPEN